MYFCSCYASKLESRDVLAMSCMVMALSLSFFSLRNFLFSGIYSSYIIKLNYYYQTNTIIYPQLQAENSRE